MNPLDVVRLLPLMARSRGRPEIAIALIDGPVATDHPDLSTSVIKEVSQSVRGVCQRTSSIACTHGTFVAGVLVARRGSNAPAICPGCTLLLRPIFGEEDKNANPMPSASPEELAGAISDAVSARANVINLSAAMVHSSSRGERELEMALDYAAQQGVLVVAAAGNQGVVGSSAITRHRWVIPTTGCDSRGRPAVGSNLGRSIGERGVAAPGENIRSLGTAGNPGIFGGTSAAAPFVTGTVALLWSEFPTASAARIKSAVSQARKAARRAIAPPLLDAWAAYEFMSRS